MKHLQMLVLLDALHHVGETARHMSTTQPAVSRMIVELETMVGERLFVRGVKGTFPTPHGKSMIRHARWILGDLDRMGKDWSEPGGVVAEVLNVGINSSSAAFLMPHALMRFEGLSPGVTVRIREGSIESLLPDLCTRKLDLVVARLGSGRPDPALVRQVLGDEPMCVVCSAGHPLVELRTPSWASLAEYPWIMPPQGSPVRVGLDLLFEQHGLDVRSCVESASVVNNMVLMDQSHALSVVPRAVANYYVRFHRLAILNVELPCVFGPIGVIRHSSLDPSAAMLTLMKCLELEAQGMLS